MKIDGFHCSEKYTINFITQIQRKIEERAVRSERYICIKESSSIGLLSKKLTRVKNARETKQKITKNRQRAMKKKRRQLIPNLLSTRSHYQKALRNINFIVQIETSKISRKKSSRERSHTLGLGRKNIRAYN